MSDGPLQIRLLGADDHALVTAAQGIFATPPIADQTRDFLASHRDFLWLAFLDGQPVGFVSATSVLHPDKPPHFFVNELEKCDGVRRRGIATRLMRTVQDYGKEHGLWTIWLAAEGGDAQAIAFYRFIDRLDTWRSAAQPCSNGSENERIRSSPNPPFRARFH